VPRDVERGYGGPERKVASVVETGMSVPRFNAMLPALALAGLLAACSEEAPTPKHARHQGADGRPP
jgi:hypothetical protein